MTSGNIFESDLDFVVSSLLSKWEHLRDKKVFLTGGTGFIGKWLLGSLIRANQTLDLNCKVTVLSRNPEGFKNSNPFFSTCKNITFVKSDLRELQPAEEKYDFFVHAAADVENVNSQIELFQNCTIGTIKALEFARQTEVQKFLLLSSGAIYGKMPASKTEFKETDTLLIDGYTSKSAYSLGKISSEWLVSHFGQTNGLHTQIARCFAFVGPYLPTDKHFAIGNFIRDAMANQEIVIKGDGTALRSYLYSADLAIWLFSILFNSKSNSCYNVGGSTPYSIAELANFVAETLGSEAGVIVQGRPLKGATADRYLPSTLLARSELGLKESFSLEKSIVRTAEFIQRGGLL